MTQPYDVQFASEHYQGWLAALERRAMLSTRNQSQAMFRTVLIELRKYLTTDQTMIFADCLPPLPRALFLEGWRPSIALEISSADALTQEVIDSLSPHQVPPRSIVADVFFVLASESTAGNATMMREALPEKLKPLWP